MSKIYYEEQIKLRTNDFDQFDNLKPSAILDIFQDVAGTHATIIGTGYDQLCKLGYYWVLLRTEFNIIKQPQLLTNVIVATWPHKKGRIDFEREYEIRNLDGEVLVTGISKWVIIDTNTRRICRTDKVNYNGEFYVDNNRYVEASKVAVEIPEDLKFELEYKVLKTDIDHNLHMNNAKYADLILNALNDEKNINTFRIEYINECKIGNIIKLYSFILNEKQYYIGYCEDKKIFISQI